jgi:hypothetical protein
MKRGRSRRAAEAGVDRVAAVVLAAAVDAAAVDLASGESRAGSFAHLKMCRGPAERSFAG